MVSDETKAKISESLKGRKLGPSKLRGRTVSAEAKAKQAAAIRVYPVGALCAVDECGKPRRAGAWCTTHYRRQRLYGDPSYVQPIKAGPESPKWQGEDVGYGAVHERGRRVLPRRCAACDETKGRLEVALLNGVPDQFLRYRADGRPYSVRDGDYVRLCVGCHRKYDSPKVATNAGVIAALEAKGLLPFPDIEA